MTSGWFASSGEAIDVLIEASFQSCGVGGAVIGAEGVADILRGDADLHQAGEHILECFDQVVVKRRWEIEGGDDGGDGLAAVAHEKLAGVGQATRGFVILHFGEARCSPSASFPAVRKRGCDFGF